MDYKGDFISHFQMTNVIDGLSKLFVFESSRQQQANLILSIFPLFFVSGALLSCWFILIKIRVKKYQQSKHMKQLILWLFLTIHFAIEMAMTGSIDPILQTSPYFESMPFNIKSDITVAISGSNPITKVIPFTKTYAQIPKLAYGIKNYQASDRIGVQKYDVQKTALSTTSFTVFTKLESFTSVRILNIFYFAVDQSCPYHINAFHEIDANFMAGPLTNISSALSTVRTYRNVIKYADLAATIGSSFTSFGTNLAKNRIMTYMSGFYQDIIVSFTTVPLDFTLSIKILSTTEFQILVTIQPYFFVQLLKYSLVIVDMADLEKTNLITAVFHQSSFQGNVNNYISVPQSVPVSGIFGFKDFSLLSITCGIELNYELDPSNNRIVFNISVPNPYSNASCALTTYTATAFYLVSYQCSNPQYPSYNKIASKCEQVICGDGIWTQANQACEDGNLNNNDGCSQFCTVENNFTCLPIDQLPNGLSLCKFTLNITLNLASIVNDQPLKTLHFYFNLHPENYTLLDQATISALIGTAQISLQTDPLTSLIPSTDITVKFNPNDYPNQVELIVLYNNQSLDQSLLNFTLTPSNTLNPSISHLQTIDYSIPVDFSKNVAPISSISPVQPSDKILEIISQTIGSISLVLIVFGFCVLSGRMIIIQMLAVIQISFFSILQLAKVPSIFIPLKFLLLSTGYTDVSKLSMNPSSKSVYSSMGLQKQIIANFNIGMALFFLPFIIGGTGMIFTKILQYKAKNKAENINEPSKESTQREALFKDTKIEDNLTENQERLEFIFNLFKKVFHQSTLYGLLVCGYLIFVSIFNSFGDNSAIDILLIALMGCFWACYSVLLIRGNENEICLSKKTDFSLQLKNSKLQTEFGDFREVHEQISRIPKRDNFPVQKLYTIFMAERIILPMLIVIVSKYFAYAPVLPMVFFVIMIATLNIANYRYQKELPEQKKSSMFSFLYKNYVLRQSINFLTIIVTEILILVFQIMSSIQGEENVLKGNLFTVKVMPYMVLSILFVNILVNMVFLIWQLKNSQVLIKAKVIISILLNSQVACSKVKAKRQKLDSSRDRKLKRENETIQNKEMSQKQESKQESEDKHVNQELNNYVKNLVNPHGLYQSVHKMSEKQAFENKIIYHSIKEKKNVQIENVKDEFHAGKPRDEFKLTLQPKQLKIKAFYGNPIYDQI